MKGKTIMKKIFSFLLVMIMCVAILASCNFIGGGNNNGSNETPGDDSNKPSDGDVVLGNGEAVLYSPDVNATIIKSPTANYKGFDFTALGDAIYFYSGGFALLNSDISPVEGPEIIIGDTSRELTAKAKAKLEYGVNMYKRTLEDNGDTSNIDFI